MRLTTASFTLIALIAMYATCGAAPPTGVPGTNPTTIPSNGNFVAHERWNIRCVERVGAAIGKPCDVIFIGDSITQNFADDADGDWEVGRGVNLHLLSFERGFSMTGRAVWAKHYAGINALDFGVGADGTEHMLWRLDNMDVRTLEPKVAVILAGTNDMQHSAAQVAEGVTAVVDKTRKLFRKTKIILVSLTPRGGMAQKVSDVNQLIKPLADEQTVFYFDLFAKMPPQSKSWVGIGGDNLHLTPDGYELWASEMQPLLDRLLQSSK